MSGSRTTSAAEEVSGLGLGSQEIVRFLVPREIPESWWEIPPCNRLFREGPSIPDPRQLTEKIPEAALLSLKWQERCLRSRRTGALRNIESSANELKLMAPAFSQCSQICPLFYSKYMVSGTLFS